MAMVRNQVIATKGTNVLLVREVLPPGVTECGRVSQALAARQQ
jgi:hypothetical protein